MPKKKRPAKRARTNPSRRHLPKGWPGPPDPGAHERSFSTFTKCSQCDEGSIDLQKFPIQHKPGCAYGSSAPVPETRTGTDGALRQMIARAINSVSAENGSNTPDFILAQFMVDCLEAFDRACLHRDALTPTWATPGPQPEATNLRHPSVPFRVPPYGPQGAMPPDRNRQQVHFAITDEQLGTFGAGWRQRLAGHAALPPNMDPRRVQELQGLALQYKNDVDLGYAVMALNGPEGFRP